MSCAHGAEGNVQGLIRGCACHTSDFLSPSASVRAFEVSSACNRATRSYGQKSEVLQLASYFVISFDKMAEF